MSFVKKYPKYKWALLLMDFLLLNLSFSLTVASLYINPFESLGVNSYNFAGEISLFLPYTIFALFYFQFSNLYKIQKIIKKRGHMLLLMKSLFFVMIGFILFQFVLTNFKIPSRLFYLEYFIFSTVLFTAIRIPFVNLLGGTALLRDKVIILGTGKKARALLDTFQNKIKVKKVIGFLDDKTTDSDINGIPILGKVEDAVELAKRNNIDYFILGFDDLNRKRFFEIFQFFNRADLGLAVSSDYLQVLYNKMNIDFYDEHGMVRFSNHEKEKWLQYSKRLFDIIASSIGILLLSPVFITLALLVKFTSKGPVVFKQIRIGKNGKPFYFFKFRSMHVNNDNKSAHNFMEDFIKGGKSAGDQDKTATINQKAFTPIGPFIRKYSLDELPQLFNVLKGDMSLVGSRPCTLNEWKVYEDWQKLRFSNIPGCTGVWQVTGRWEVDFEEIVLMDIFYNQNYSPWLDIKLILQTIPVMIFGKGGG